ncbi:putative quinol monooxygenase [Pseudoxanthomonas sp. PXM02]|uniref:putative quinol monooxygenase n=1 Tax=Pseudoxanthomonas sp. PXM02 TaxID=2769294 RepID=UPI0017868006|nr:putative quinol monooxygenase [Pseudoxanthomonas sp. PXM02]MBD9478242.1 antibiotic biosynthesis monooxygenase [Pseudoxanthomonas sp. PXM02]
MKRYPLLRGALLLAALALPGTPAIAADTSPLQYGALPAGAYAVVAEVRAKAGKEEALRAVTLPLVEQVRAEPNNLLYFLHEDRQAPGHFVFYEIFKTQADFEAHNATPHVQAWFAHLPELADGGVKVIRMEILGNEGTRSP